jgi:hypothetical protein
VITLVGVGLIAYSRNEVLHPVKPVKKPAAVVAPTTADNWHAALGVDICGTFAPTLAPASDATTVGIRTFGDDVIDIEPGIASAPAQYEGKNATLGTFTDTYPNFILSHTLLQVPATKPKLYRAGERCDGKKAVIEAAVWSSPTAKRSRLVTTNPADIKFANGQMITVAFLPKGVAIPRPPARAALIKALSSSAGTTTTTTPSKTSTTKASTSSTKPATTSTTKATKGTSSSS